MLYPNIASKKGVSNVNEKYPHSLQRCNTPTNNLNGGGSQILSTPRDSKPSLETIYSNGHKDGHNVRDTPTPDAPSKPASSEKDRNSIAGAEFCNSFEGVNKRNGDSENRRVLFSDEVEVDVDNVENSSYQANKSKTKPVIHNRTTAEKTEEVRSTKSAAQRSGLPRTPKRKSETSTNNLIPLIYGSNVTMDSPDPLSTFHNPARVKQPMNITGTIADYHGDDVATTPMAKSTASPKGDGSSIPLIYGSNVTMDSPDPLSKFHATNSQNITPAAVKTPLRGKSQGKTEGICIQGYDVQDSGAFSFFSSGEEAARHNFEQEPGASVPAVATSRNPMQEPTIGGRNKAKASAKSYGSENSSDSFSSYHSDSGENVTGEGFAVMNFVQPAPLSGGVSSPMTKSMSAGQLQEVTSLARTIAADTMRPSVSSISLSALGTKQPPAQAMAKPSGKSPTNGSAPRGGRRIVLGDVSNSVGNGADSFVPVSSSNNNESKACGDDGSSIVAVHRKRGSSVNSDRQFNSAVGSSPTKQSSLKLNPVLNTNGSNKENLHSRLSQAILEKHVVDTDSKGSIKEKKNIAVVGPIAPSAPKTTRTSRGFVRKGSNTLLPGSGSGSGSASGAKEVSGADNSQQMCTSIEFKKSGEHESDTSTFTSPTSISTALSPPCNIDPCSKSSSSSSSSSSSADCSPVTSLAAGLGMDADAKDSAVSLDMYSSQEMKEAKADAKATVPALDLSLRPKQSAETNVSTPVMTPRDAATPRVSHPLRDSADANLQLASGCFLASAHFQKVHSQLLYSHAKHLFERSVRVTRVSGGGPRKTKRRNQKIARYAPFFSKCKTIFDTIYDHDEVENSQLPFWFASTLSHLVIECCRASTARNKKAKQALLAASKNQTPDDDNCNTKKLTPLGVSVSDSADSSSAESTPATTPDSDCATTSGVPLDPNAPLFEKDLYGCWMKQQYTETFEGSDAIAPSSVALGNKITQMIDWSPPVESSASAHIVVALFQAIEDRNLPALIDTMRCVDTYREKCRALKESQGSGEAEEEEEYGAYHSMDDSMLSDTSGDGEGDASMLEDDENEFWNRITDVHGNSLLCVAIQRKWKKGVKWLYHNMGCDINVQNKSGNTALHFAYELKYNDVVRYLQRYSSKTQLDPAQMTTNRLSSKILKEYIVNNLGMTCHQRTSLIPQEQMSEMDLTGVNTCVEMMEPVSVSPFNKAPLVHSYALDSHSPLQAVSGGSPALIMTADEDLYDFS